LSETPEAEPEESAEPRRPWGVPVATVLLLVAAAASLLSAVLTLVVFIPAIDRWQRTLESTGIGGVPPHWTVAAAALTVVLAAAAAALALAAWSGRPTAYPLLLGATLLVLPCAWCWGTGGDVGPTCAVAEWADDSCGSYSGMSWYFDRWMPALATIQFVGWLGGIVLLLLTVPERFWSRATWGLERTDA